MHCNTPLITIWQISVCAIYDTICIEGLYMKCYKILKIEKNATIWHINITFFRAFHSPVEPFHSPPGGNSPLVKNPWSRPSVLGHSESRFTILYSPKSGIKENSCHESNQSVRYHTESILCVCAPQSQSLFPANCSKRQYQKRSTCGGIYMPRVSIKTVDGRVPSLSIYKNANYNKTTLLSICSS